MCRVGVEAQVSATCLQQAAGALPTQPGAEGWANNQLRIKRSRFPRRTAHTVNQSQERRGPPALKVRAGRLGLQIKSCLLSVAGRPSRDVCVRNLQITRLFILYQQMPQSLVISSWLTRVFLFCLSSHPHITLLHSAHLSRMKRWRPLWVPLKSFL